VAVICSSTEVYQVDVGLDVHESRSHDRPSRGHKSVATSPLVCPHEATGIPEGAAASRNGHQRSASRVLVWAVTGAGSQGDTHRREVICLILRVSTREGCPCGEARRKTAVSQLAQRERAGRCILPSGHGTGRVTPRHPSCQHRREASEPLGGPDGHPEGLALRVPPRGFWGRRQFLRFQHG
jgi:hypothetical protein